MCLFLRCCSLSCFTLSYLTFLLYNAFLCLTFSVPDISCHFISYSIMTVLLALLHLSALSTHSWGQVLTFQERTSFHADGCWIKIVWRQFFNCCIYSNIYLCMCDFLTCYCWVYFKKAFNHCIHCSVCQMQWSLLSCLFAYRIFFSSSSSLYLASVLFLIIITLPSVTYLNLHVMV